jgi:hypothetical protein
LKDLIDIFKAHDWDRSYHAFREWEGSAAVESKIVDGSKEAITRPSARDCANRYLGESATWDFTSQGFSGPTILQAAERLVGHN